MSRRRKPWSPDDMLPAPYQYQVVSRNAAALGRKDQNGIPIREGTGSWWKPQAMTLAFDDLPQPVRVALANSAHDWAPHWAKSAIFWRFSPALIIERIERADREEAQRRELNLLAGKG